MKESCKMLLGHGYVLYFSNSSAHFGILPHFWPGEKTEKITRDLFYCCVDAASMCFVFMFLKPLIVLSL